MVNPTLIGILFICANVIGHNVANALFFDEPNWNTLRVTWGLKLWKSYVFERMPLTESDAKDKGYTKINTECKGTFLGFRYMKPGNTSLVLIYDVNGYIAGIQSGFPKDTISRPELKEWFQKSPLLIDDELDGTETFTATGYFVDPALICTTGRTAKEFNKDAAGVELSIQKKGSDPENDLMKIPKSEKEVEASGWTKGKCFPSMGVHYWYNVSKDMNCDNFLPAFLLYNRGTLTGFGWAVTNMYNSDRYEHPPKDAFSKFFAEVPECFNNMYDVAQGFSTMHIFMNFRPWNVIC